MKQQLDCVEIVFRVQFVSLQKVRGTHAPQVADTAYKNSPYTLCTPARDADDVHNGRTSMSPFIVLVVFFFTQSKW